MVDDLIQAREAYSRQQWVAAYDGLSHARTEDLHADDFVLLAKAAYLLGRRNDCVRALQMAYNGSVAAGETLAAARCAFWLAMVLITSGETAVGGGWVSRCQRLLDGVDGDVVERGYLLVHLMFRHLYQGEFAEALPVAVEITSYGKRFGDPDLLAMGLMAQGRMAIYSGRVPDGVAMLDEAMVGVSAGEVSPIITGQVWCAMIEACQEVSDFARVEQWSRALGDWCDEQPGLLPFTGQCAVHRGQVHRVHGNYVAALAELSTAVQRYHELGDLPPIGLAMHERGEVLRIRGDFDAAEEAFEEAISLGHEPQPSLALLWLDRGRTAAAVGAARRMLAEPGSPVRRAQLLPAAIQILLAAGEVQAVTPLVEELTAIASGFGCSALVAAAALASGAEQLARDDPGAALPHLRTAVQQWQALGAPYESARARVLSGRALHGLGDGDSARAELHAARQAFAEIGARPAELAAAGLLTGQPRPCGLTEREVEVLRLVAGGNSNAAIASLLFLSEKTVARHLSNIFTKIDVSSRTAAAAFAFENGLV